MKLLFSFTSSGLYFLLSICCMAQGNEVSYMKSGGPLRPLQQIMDIRHYTIALDVDIANKSIDGYTQIDLVLLKPTDTLLFDLYRKYTIHNIKADGSGALFSQAGDSLLITGSFRAGKHAIKISYGGQPPVAARPPWDGGFTWGTDSSNNPWVVINCQLQGAKIYYPCKDHPSDEANEGADLFITVPKKLSVAGPGLLQSVKAVKYNKATWHWRTNYTISNYCILFNIARYKVEQRNYTSIEGHQVPIQFYVLEDDTAFAGHLIDMRERDTRILEKYFGEYPWIKEKIGIAQVSNPGMEHQTMITYGDKFRYRNYPGFDYSANLFHEFAHEWWANKITNRDWGHMWIQEGITTYAEALFFREMLGEPGYDSMITSIKGAIKNTVPVVQGEGLDMGKAYHGDIYTKGAFFMHTLRYILGDSVFFPALKKLIAEVRYPYNKFFDTEDIQQFFSAQSNKNLRPLFNFYLRTNQKIEFYLFRFGASGYNLRVTNVPMDLPLEIRTGSGIVKVNLVPGENRLKLASDILPVIDPGDHYFKRIILE